MIGYALTNSSAATGISGPAYEDVEAAQRYGEMHPDVFGGLRVEGDRLQVGLTVVEPYADDLRAQLQDPDAVDVVAVEYTEKQLAALQDEVMRRAQAAGVFLGCGRGFQLVHVSLRPNGVPHARELHAEFGNRLAIAVGRRRYPPTGDVDKLRAAPTSTTSIPGLTIRVVLDVAEVPSGAFYEGHVILRNTGTGTIRLDSGQPLAARLVDRDGYVAGVDTRPVAGTGLGLNLLPGQEGRIRFHGGTAGSGEHYATPPGDYDVVVVLPLFGPAPAGQLVSPAVPLRVT